MVKGLSRAEEGAGHHYTAEVSAGQVEGFNFYLAVGGLVGGIGPGGSATDESEKGGGFGPWLSCGIGAGLAAGSRGDAWLGLPC